jgi:hypothetical protein
MDDKLNDPVSAIMPETNYITAGIAFRPFDSYSFNRSNYTISAGISLHHV